MKKRGVVMAGALAAGVAVLVGVLTGCLRTEGTREVKPDAVEAPGSAPFGVTTRDFTVPGPSAGPVVGVNRVGSEAVPVRQYEPVQPDGTPVEPWAELVWAHGGSFRHGGLDMAESHWVAWQFAAAGMRVFAVDYALASDTVKAPAPANDVTAVARWAAEREAGSTAPLMIGGASAGAHLATLAALELSGPGVEAAVGPAAHRLPAALLLEYPTLHRTQLAAPEISALTSELAPRLQFDRTRIAEMYDYYLGGAAAAVVSRDGLVAGELAAERLSQLPPVIMVNAEADDLRASGEQFAGQLSVAGVSVTAHTEPGTTHGYLNRGETPADAAAASRTIERFVAAARALVDAS